MSIVGANRPPGSERAKSDEEDVGVADEGPNDTVAINKPPENASIAEAKPVAVSVAGVGGMASAQPVATAVVGHGGLALTRPIATAIAGIEGAENLVAGHPPPAAAAKSRLVPGSSDPSSNLVYGVLPPQAVIYLPVPLY
ncbi:hypothetical protein AAG570_008756 [Ranatra chinensis]|uniref:DUF4774 domain-containing protein n=1 Tax=Ranatra chinensis TaxID=642074 RepID=A0ABD0YU00_9HEMI